MMFAIPFLLASSLVVDAVNHSVTIPVKSTDCGVDTPLEFLIVGPDSEKDYEAMFTSIVSTEQIFDAFKAAGIPIGSHVDFQHSKFWPVGEKLEMTPRFNELVKETFGEKVPDAVFTGGVIDSNGRSEAATNMPLAVFALYNCPQSYIQLNDSLEQSPTYGRFKVAEKIPAGQTRNITFKWNGSNTVEKVKVAMSSTNILSQMTMLMEKSKHKELDVELSFAPQMTVEEATRLALALVSVDSPRVKLNGCKAGELFYRAYIPLEKWRERKSRLMQPPEVHLNANGTCKVVEIKEDWSRDDTTEPELIVKEYDELDVTAAGKLLEKLADRTNTILVFVSKREKLSRLYDLRGKSGDDKIVNWYVFGN